MFSFGLFFWMNNISKIKHSSLLRHFLSILNFSRRFQGFRTQKFFSQECNSLKWIFLKLKYPQRLIDAAINRVCHPPDPLYTPSDSPIRIIIPYKDQRSADVVRKQLRNLGRKIDLELQPIFTSKKILDDLRVTELKPPLVNQQSVVYEFRCDLCDTDYIGYTRRHLHQRVEEHKHSLFVLVTNILK